MSILRSEQKSSSENFETFKDCSNSVSNSLAVGMHENSRYKKWEYLFSLVFYCLVSYMRVSYIRVSYRKSDL